MDSWSAFAARDTNVGTENTHLPYSMEMALDQDVALTGERPELQSKTWGHVALQFGGSEPEAETSKSHCVRSPRENRCTAETLVTAKQH